MCGFALDALEHNPDFPQLLLRLAAKLSHGGILILSGPTENHLYRLGRRIAGFDAHYHATNIYAIETATQAILARAEVCNLPWIAPLFRLPPWRVDMSKPS